MKAAFILYTLLLLAEGLLAWALTGEAFLPVVSFSALALYASTYQGSNRRLPEGLRLLAAMLLVIGGPWRYQGNFTAMLLCFIAMPHLMAATQALWETRRDAGAAPSDSARMRTVVFTVAFYAAMGFSFLLLRGVEPALTRLQSFPLAVLVALAALPAWDRSVVLRLKPAVESKRGAFERGRSSARAALLLAALMLLTAALFSGPLPALANLLTRLSPRWSVETEFNTPPPPMPPGDPAEERPSPAPAPATRPGLDSAGSGTHRLPRQADIQGSGDIRMFIQPADPAQASALLNGERLYIRSHTLDLFRDGVWQRTVTAGVWREDAADGQADGVVTLRPSGPGAVRHTVYLLNADGYSLPAIQGVDALKLPRVFTFPGDVFQLPATGNIRYEAVSTPRIFDRLPNPAYSSPGAPQSRSHLDTGRDDFAERLEALGSTLFAGRHTVAERVAALREYFRREFTYSTQIRNPRDLEALNNFLFQEKRGYCDFYASAAALLLRAAGVPTRVAYGYAAEEWDESAGVFIVRDHNAHSWTEIFLRDEGWTVCDFTPAENAGRLPSSTPPQDASSLLPDREAERPEEKPAPASGFDPSQFKDPTEHLLPKTETKTKVEISGWFSTLMTTLRESEWLTPSSAWVLALLPALAAVFALIRLFSRENVAARQTAKAEKERARRERQPEYFVELLRVCDEAGHPKPDGATPMEFFRSLLRAGLPVPPLKPMIQYHCRVRYEDLPRDPEREKSFFAQIRELEKTLKQGEGPRV